MLIGTATSAYQVEGNNKNSDWWYYEKIGKLKYKSGLSSDHYHLYRTDIDIMKKLNLNSYRFSIEFSRIYPNRNNIDKKEIEHYKEVISDLNKNQIEPIVTLWHYTLPKWFLDIGGFENRENINIFIDYVEVLLKHGLDIRYVLTMNEPLAYSINSYLVGKYPPFERSIIKFLRVQNNLIEMHNKLYRLLKQYDYEVSFAHAMYSFFNKNLVYPAYKISNYILNEEMLRRTKLDFIGINYYKAISMIPRPSLRRPFKTEMRWRINPDGLYSLIKSINFEYHKPIMITENGVATKNEVLRGDFIRSHFNRVLRAKREGVPVIGYMYWSFIDNFEWIYGYTKHFGIVAFDPMTLKRHIKPSAYVLKNIAIRYRRY